MLSALYDVSLDSFFQNDLVETEKIELVETSKSLISKGFLVICLISVISYFISPFGLILIPVILFFSRKIKSYKVIIYILCLVSLWRNGQDLYYLLNSNSENEIITIKELGE